MPLTDIDMIPLSSKPGTGSLLKQIKPMSRPHPPPASRSIPDPRSHKSLMELFKNYFICLLPGHKNDDGCVAKSTSKFSGGWRLKVESGAEREKSRSWTHISTAICFKLKTSIVRVQHCFPLLHLTLKLQNI